MLWWLINNQVGSEEVRYRDCLDAEMLMCLIGAEHGYLRPAGTHCLAARGTFFLYQQP